MFNINSVEIIPSQLGSGLKIKDFEVGCARIVDVELDNNTPEENGLSLGYMLIENEGDNVLYFEEDIKNANNYVLVKIENGTTTTLTNSKDICDIFELPETDAEILAQYIGALATDRQLVMKQTKDLNGDDLMFFTNSFDNELTQDYINGDIDAATSKYLSFMSSADYRAEHSSHNFIKMFLIAIITACQDRYNKVYRGDALEQAANILRNIKFWNDGQLCNPSILDIENYINDIKSIIRVQ